MPGTFIQLLRRSKRRCLQKRRQLRRRKSSSDAHPITSRLELSVRGSPCYALFNLIPITGLPNVGKSSFFNVLSNTGPFCLPPFHARSQPSSQVTKLSFFCVLTVIKSLTRSRQGLQLSVCHNRARGNRDGSVFRLLYLTLAHAGSTNPSPGHTLRLAL